MAGDYTAQLAMHARLSRGGYTYAYVVSYRGQEIGTAAAVKHSRKVLPVTTFTLGDTDYPTWEAFKAAHQAQLAAAARGGEGAPTHHE